MFYLFGSLFVVLCLVIVLRLRPDLTRQAVVPALWFLPYGSISELIYFRDYWQPEPVLPSLRIFGQLFLIEDVIFSFGIVGLMSVLYDVVLRRRPSDRRYPARLGLAVRLSLLALLSFILLSLYTPLNSILVGALVAVGFALPMLYLRRDLIPVALGSSLLIGLATGLFYFAILSLPGGIDYLVQVWKLPLTEATWLVWGIPIPLTEVLWAASTAAYFGVIYKFGVGRGESFNDRN